MMPEATPLALGLFAAAVAGILACGWFIAKRRARKQRQIDADAYNAELDEIAQALSDSINGSERK